MKKKENRINIAKLLKDCPKGMELDCAILDNVVFDHVDIKSDYPIIIETKDGSMVGYFTKFGQCSTHDDAKCIIFPKGKTTWEGFEPPCKFKEGDIIFIEDKYSRHWCSIYKCVKDGDIYNYLDLCIANMFIVNYNRKPLTTYKDAKCRLATEEEKQKLFKAIKEHGYKWNNETKTLDELIKPKFKVGDRVRNKKNKKQRIITKIHQDCYECDDRYALTFENQDKWELVSNKFDISTLKPFESRVLVRAHKTHFWKPAIFGGYINNCSDDYKYIVIGEIFYKYLIPYKNNEHLLCTTNDCDEYYKTWEE